MTAQYRLLTPHYFATGYAPAGATVTEGNEIPNSWVPTLAVDPLNTDAVNAFYSAGPRDNCNENLNLWSSGFAAVRPATAWKQTGSGYLGAGSFWTLTGLGAGKAPIPIPQVLSPRGGQTPGLPPAGVP